MPIRPPEYDSLANELMPSLNSLSPTLIAITGSLCAGKTTLARFLAWYFNVALIETDHFLIPHQSLTYDATEIGRIVSNRLLMDRPIIVEGYSVLKVLVEIKRTPDIIIHLQNKSVKSAKRNIEHDPVKWGFQSASYYSIEVSH